MAKRPGRKLKLTPERQKMIIDAILGGNFVEVACRYAGIADCTFYDWLEKGRQGRQPYKDFLEAYEQAQAQAEVAAVAQLRAHGRDNPGAIMNFLERRFPKRWGRQIQISGEGGGPIRTEHTHKLDLSSLSTEELDILERLIAKAGGEQ